MKLEGNMLIIAIVVLFLAGALYGVYGWQPTKTALKL